MAFAVAEPALGVVALYVLLHLFVFCLFLLFRFVFRLRSAATQFFFAAWLPDLFSFACVAPPPFFFFFYFLLFFFFSFFSFFFLFILFH